MEFAYEVLQKDGRDGVRFSADITAVLTQAPLESPPHDMTVGIVQVQFSDVVTYRSTTIVNPDGTVDKTIEHGVYYYCAVALTEEFDGDYRWLLV